MPQALLEKFALSALSYLEAHPEVLQKVFGLLLQAIVKHVEAAAPAGQLS